MSEFGEVCAVILLEQIDMPRSEILISFWKTTKEKSEGELVTVRQDLREFM